MRCSCIRSQAVEIKRWRGAPLILACHCRLQDQAMTASHRASLAMQIGSPLDKANVGLFRLKALAGGAYDSLSRPETTTLQRLRVRKAY